MQRNTTKLKSQGWPRILAGILMVLAGMVGLSACEKSPGQQTPGASALPPAVSVVTVGTQKVTLTTVLPGRTSAYRIAEIRPQVSGLILKRLFTEGANVTAGQALYQIDPAPFQASLDNAKAALGRAQANLSAAELRVERYKELIADKAVSQQSYDDAMAAMAQVKADIAFWEASVKTARINLGYTRIDAPISGRIGRSNVTDGAIVTAYQPMALATIQQLDPIYVDVPQATTEQLHQRGNGLDRGAAKESKVTLMMEDGSVYPNQGTLQFSDVSVDPTTGSVILRVVFPNPENVLLPNMFVRAEIIEGIDEKAIMVPQQGVSRDPKGNPFALIVDAENKAVYRPLSLDRAIGDQWRVSSGLVPGDQLIVEGLLMLRPGTEVTATPFEPTPVAEETVGGTGAASGNQREGGAS